jgi:hypothetical protein
MAVILMIDHRLAFFALVVLLIAAGVPLAFAWARLLPEDPPPFPIEPGSFPSIDEVLPHQAPATPMRDLLAIPLLVCVTLVYLIRFPGFPRGVAVRWLDTIVSPSTILWIVFAIRIFLIVSAIAAAAYAASRPGRLRVPLAAAATLVMILWFLGPVLDVALLSGP